MTLSEFHPDLLESRQTNATVKLRRRIDRVMVKRRRFVGHSVDRFRYNAPCTENGSASAREGRKLFEQFLRKINKLQARQQLEAQAQGVTERSRERGPI
jgi:hypothetical protein